MNLDRVIWEGWRVRDFIEDAEDIIDLIMNEGSWRKPFKNKVELNEWLKDNQPYYKKPIKEVQQYFAEKYNLK